MVLLPQVGHKLWPQTKAVPGLLALWLMMDTHFICLFNLNAEYIMQNARLDESQAGIKIAGRNINNLIYADDTTLMAESEEELKSLLMKAKEESDQLAQNSTFKKLRSWRFVPSLHGK